MNVVLINEQNQEKIINARLKRAEVYRKILARIFELEDPMNITVSELVDELAETKDSVESSLDIVQGVRNLEGLNVLRQKQDEILLDIARGARLSPEQNQFYQFLFTIINDRKERKRFLEWSERFPLKYTNSFLNLFWNFTENKKKLEITQLKKRIEFLHLEDLFKTIDSHIRHGKSKTESNIPTIYDQEYITKTVDSIASETSSYFHKKLISLATKIAQQKTIFLLPLIWSDSYQETLHNLEAVSILISSGVVTLKDLGQNKKNIYGRYKLTFNDFSENTQNFNLHAATEKASIVFGLTFEEWKNAQQYIKNGEWDKRPPLTYFD